MACSAMRASKTSAVEVIFEPASRPRGDHRLAVLRGRMVPALSCLRKIQQNEQNRRLISEMNAVLHFRMRGTRRGRLPKLLMLYIDPAPWGHVAEWLRNGLQNLICSALCHRRNPFVSGIFSFSDRCGRSAVPLFVPPLGLALFLKPRPSYSFNSSPMRRTARACPTWIICRAAAWPMCAFDRAER
jgi:hypothetical protein